MRKRIYTLAIVFTFIFTSISFAHSGRTDSSGGHRDNKNKSGLGSYHYHCGGYPAHLHKNGACPYKTDYKTSTGGYNPTTSSNFSNTVTDSKQNNTTTEEKAIKRDPVTLYIDGQKQEGNELAYIENGTTFIKLRTYSDLTGATIEHDSAQNIYTAKNDLGWIKLSTIPDEYVATHISEGWVKLPAATNIINGSITVPIRIMTEALGGTIEKYDSATSSLYVVFEK